MSELTPWDSGFVPERSLTNDEREVILKHLFDRAALQAQDEKTRMAVRFRVGQTIHQDVLVEEAVTTVAKRQSRVTHPEVQGFMERHRAESLMDMKSDVRAILRSGADVMDDIVSEPYTRYTRPTGRQLTLRELLSGRTDE